MSLKKGKVVKGLGGLYEVLTEDRSERIVCRAKGVFRHTDLKLLIGDNVEIEQGEIADQTVISKILPRKNQLIRPPLANLDMLFVVVAAAYPSPALSTIDKLIAIAEYNGIEVIPVFTKKDLCESKQYEEIYKKIVGNGGFFYRLFLFGHTNTVDGNKKLSENNFFNQIFSIVIGSC